VSRLKAGKVKLHGWARYEFRGPEGASVATGYYGVPGSFGGLVHVAVAGRPLCGTRLALGSQFQWCAHGVQTGYLECQRCKRLVAKAIENATPVEEGVV